MKRLAILVVAIFAVALMESQSEAQCYGNRGFRGGSGFNISIGSGGFNRGFGGVGYGGGFNRGFGGFGPSFGYSSYRPSYRSYRPVYSAPIYRAPVYRGGFGGGFGGGCGY